MRAARTSTSPTSPRTARAGHRVDVFTRRDGSARRGSRSMRAGRARGARPGGTGGPVPKERLLQHMPASSPLSCSASARRRAAAGTARYEILHANFFMSGLAGLAVRRALQVPMVTTFHALGRVRRRAPGRVRRLPDERFGSRKRCVVRNADRVIAECPQDRDDLVRLYDGDASRIAVVPCGFDAAEFGRSTGCTRERSSAGSRRVHRAAAGPPGAPQGHRQRDPRAAPVAARFDARAAARGGRREPGSPDPRLTPEIGRLRAVAGRRASADRVTFDGRRDRDVLQLYYGAADVFVTTPWYEPFGITPVEAMACARPVIGAQRRRHPASTWSTA